MKKWTTESLFNALKHIKLAGNTCLYTIEKCEELVPIINRINILKQEKNAIVLAHSYVVPDIIHTVADFTGDSYELSKRAKESSANTIIFSAVKFMAESAKLLNPNKTVIAPSEPNGCSLADSITGEDVKKLKQQYPNYAFVCYINTTADVKAECDVCVTSSNVYAIVEAIPNENIYFLPDKLMGKNIINELEKKGIKKNIKFWGGTCYVHEEYSPEMIEYIRIQYPDVHILAHPECDESIIKQSDYVGSTSQMINAVKNSNHKQYFLLTECGLTSRLQLEVPSKTFVGTCTMCKYMKANSLSDIEKALIDPKKDQIIEISEETRQKALSCIDAMFEYTSKIQQSA